MGGEFVLIARWDLTPIQEIVIQRYTLFFSYCFHSFINCITSYAPKEISDFVSLIVDAVSSRAPTSMEHLTQSVEVYFNLGLFPMNHFYFPSG